MTESTKEKPNKERKGSMRKILYLWIPIVAVLADQLTKVLAYNGLRGHEEAKVLGDVVVFSYLENTGAAWGILRGRFDVLALVTAVILLAFLYVIARIPSDPRYRLLLVTLLITAGGAIGNLFDRVFRGYVIDFIYLKFIHFPIFNVADIFVTCGVFFFAILLLFVYKDEELWFIPFFGEKDKHSTNTDNTP